MVKIHASITFSGKNFSPNLVEKELGILFTKKYEKRDLSTNKKHQHQVGFASIEAPVGVSFFERISWICSQIDRKTIKSLKKIGANNIVITIGYFYYKQCNCELNTNELKAISKLEIPFAFSCYKCTKKEFDEII